MRQIHADLWETEVESPLPGLTTHAYLLTGKTGNVLFYNTGHLHEIDQMEALGGVHYQYLSHRDELGDTLNVISKRFGTKLGGHVLEQEDFARVRSPDILFDRREMHLGNVEVIPTPGHSPGSTCFLVHSDNGAHYLFTGDTLYFSNNEAWKPGLLPGSDRGALIDSLKLLRTLEPDIVLSSAFAGDAGFQEISAVDWKHQVDTAIGSLRQHAD